MITASFMIFKDEHASIRELRICSNPEQLSIMVDQSIEFDSIYNWDLTKNQEIEGWDVCKNYEVVWDSLGNMYIVANDTVFFAKQHCRLKSFKIKENEISKSMS